VLYLVNKLQIPHIVTLCTYVLEVTAQTEAVIPAALVQLWQPVLYLVNKLQIPHIVTLCACVFRVNSSD